jgi:predicted short-subunit dehydrogenase-like oxidoreductase (DUF2520 family)
MTRNLHSIASLSGLPKMTALLVRRGLGAPGFLTLCYPRPVKPPTITLIGPGRLGSALAKHLRSAGCTIVEIVCRDRNSVSRVRALAREVNAVVTTAHSARLDADIIWFCVPDSQISGAANALSSRSWRRRIALHSSGVLTSDVLAPLREAGAGVASAHPLMTFVRGSAPDLSDVPFALEGDALALRTVKQVVRRLGGRPVPIRKQDKPAYHLFAVMICPLLISLLAASERAAKLADISKNEARRRMLPIVRQTISNYEKLGAAAAFTGPFVRGDVETVRLHLKALSRSSGLRSVYAALAEAALQNLPHRNANEIRAALNS